MRTHRNQLISQPRMNSREYFHIRYRDEYCPFRACSRVPARSDVVYTPANFRSFPVRKRVRIGIELQTKLCMIINKYQITLFISK